MISREGTMCFNLDERALVQPLSLYFQAASAGGGHQEELGGENAPLRNRGDTGVASLLVQLAKADPSGDTIRSMQRWACEAILPEEVWLLLLATLSYRISYEVILSATVLGYIFSKSAAETHNSVFYNVICFEQRWG